MTTEASRWLWLLPEARKVLQTRDLPVILRYYRRTLGLSQSAMGERLGFERSYLSLIEQRRRTVNDRQLLAHFARELALPPHVLGLVTDQDADLLAATQFGSSVVRLAEVSRQAGRAGEAVDELWPLVARLEARTGEGRIDYATADVLARAQTTLGTCLGHVLPEEQLHVAARWTGKGLRLSRHLDDPSILAHALRMHGNELRKAGRSGAAVARLSEAAERASGDGERGQTLVLLARAAGEQGNAAVFDEVVATAQQLLDSTGPSGILFTRFAVREVEMRGLLQTGRVDRAAHLARHPSGQSAPAPQWATIEAVTCAAALARVGDTHGAHELCRRALAMASEQRLPHQIQRLVRHTRASGYGSVRSEARDALRVLRLPARSTAAGHA